MKITITKTNGETSIYKGKLIEENADGIVLETEDGVTRITRNGCSSVEIKKNILGG